MELEEKKEHVVRCIKLGMDNMSAMIIAQCSTSDIELLDGDDSFQRKLTFNKSLLEMKLLEKHEIGRHIAALKGATHGIEWMLEKVNKKQWGNKVSDDVQPVNVNVYLPEKSVKE